MYVYLDLKFVENNLRTTGLYIRIYINLFSENNTVRNKTMVMLQIICLLQYKFYKIIRFTKFTFNLHFFIWEKDNFQK